LKGGDKFAIQREIQELNDIIVLWEDLTEFTKPLFQ